MKLSILVPTLDSRSLYLSMMLSSLEGQLTPEVEVLTEIDRGEKTIGEKRNILLERATGDYISFVDDDDIVAYDYVDSILRAIETSPDVVGIHTPRRRGGDRSQSRERKKTRIAPLPMPSSAKGRPISGIGSPGSDLVCTGAIS